MSNRDAILDPIEELLASHPPEIRTITGLLRQMARGMIPTAHEFAYHGAINYGAGTL